MDLLTKLNEKIDGLLKNYEELKKENESLKNELSNVKTLLEEKDAKLLECQENISLKELELEEILTKLEGILGK